jgi:hypothetical protein
MPIACAGEIHMELNPYLIKIKFKAGLVLWLKAQIQTMRCGPVVRNPKSIKLKVSALVQWQKDEEFYY